MLASCNDVTFFTQPAHDRLRVAAVTGVLAGADELAATAAALVPIVASAPAGVLADHHAKAPADEYFGRLKLSILGVRNVVYDIDARADNAAEDAARGFCHNMAT